MQRTERESTGKQILWIFDAILSVCIWRHLVSFGTCCISRQLTRNHWIPFTHNCQRPVPMAEKLACSEKLSLRTFKKVWGKKQEDLSKIYKRKSDKYRLRSQVFQSLKRDYFESRMTVMLPVVKIAWTSYMLHANIQAKFFYCIECIKCWFE